MRLSKFATTQLEFPVLTSGVSGLSSLFGRPFGDKPKVWTFFRQFTQEGSASSHVAINFDRVSYDISAGRLHCWEGICAAIGLDL